MELDREAISEALANVLGDGFVGSVTFHIPPEGRVRMVIETRLGKTASVIDRGHKTALRSVANR